MTHRSILNRVITRAFNRDTRAATAIVSVLCWSVFGLSQAAIAEESKPKSLTVAVQLGLTGDAAIHSANIRKGVELAAEDLKAQGWQVNLHYEDDQTNAAKTVTVMQRLISEGYELFIGPTWDFQVNAIRGVVPKRHILAMAPAVTSDLNGGPIPGVFNLATPRRECLPQLVSWLKAKGVRRGFILVPNGPWGEIHRGLFKKAMEEAGGAVVGEEAFDYGIDAASIRVLVLKAKSRASDIILTTGASGETANIVRSRNTLGLSVPIIGTEDLQDALTLQLLTKEDVKENVLVMRAKVSPGFLSRYRGRYGDSPGDYADGGYNALVTLAQATERTDGSPEAMQTLLLSGAEFEAGSRTFRFDQQGDIKGGEMELAPLGQ